MFVRASLVTALQGPAEAATPTPDPSATASPAITTGAVRNLAGFQANTLPANDDGSTGLVPIGFSLDFFGATYDHLYVNNNGNVTFDGSLITFTPFGLSTTTNR